MARCKVWESIIQIKNVIQMIKFIELKEYCSSFYYREYCVLFASRDVYSFIKFVRMSCFWLDIVPSMRRLLY